MSLSLGERFGNEPTLQLAVRNARDEDIVMFAATPDKGRNETNSALARVQQGLEGGGPKIITACDSDGVILNKSPPGVFDYMICGQDVDAGTVEYSDELPVISGSSVSTAIASGIASLTLSCTIYADTSGKYNDNPGGENRGWRNAVVKGRLEHMVTGGDQSNPHQEHYVRLNKFCINDVEMVPGLVVNDDFMNKQFK
jgi:hypothetical protein